MTSETIISWQSKRRERGEGGWSSEEEEELDEPAIPMQNS
jgi:hypothetical protein